MLRYSVQVFGRVQGVFFRANTMEKCMDLGLNGWVRNEEDGSVKIEVQGDKLKLDDVIFWIENGGPKFAKVDKVKVREQEELKPYKDFRILYE